MTFSNSGAVATLYTPSYNRMTTTSGRYGTSRISASDRPHYSSLGNSYNLSSSRFSTPSTRSSTIGSSYRLTYDNYESTASRISRERDRERDRENKEEISSSYVPRSLKNTSDFGSTPDRYSSSTYKRYLSSSSSPSSSGLSSTRRYGSSSVSTSSLASGVTSSLTSGVTSEVTDERRQSVEELRRRFDSGLVLSVQKLNNPAGASPNPAPPPPDPDISDQDRPDSPLEGARSSVSESERIRESSPSQRIGSATSSAKVVEKGGLNGLRNIGNTCFMNSVIQCLSNTKPLLEYLIEDKYTSEINSTVSSMKGALIKAFASVVQELWAPNAEDRVVNTSAFKGQVQRFAPRFMGYSQQDAQEFLRYLLEGLHEDVNRVQVKPKPITTDIDDSLSDNQKASEAWKRYLRMDDSKVMDIFVGQLKSTLQCTECKHCSVTFDPFWDLSLPLPSRSGSLKLQACLDMFGKEEVLDGDEKPTCSMCQARRKCTKKFTIQKFPRILVLHLKRFSPTEKFRGKLSNTVEFPLTGLDMSAYAAARGQGCSYNLYAVSNHAGTTYSGHYTAYCRHPYTKSWHEYNDSRVSSLSSRSIVSGEAYVLFYELSSQTSHL